MSDRKQLPGKFVWFELVSSDAKKAQAFYGEMLGWKLGASIPMNPEDIPGIGRFGVLQNPTGAVLAIMKPLPRQEQR